MINYVVTYRVNNIKTQETVKAISPSSAKAIIRSKYQGAVLRFISIKSEIQTIPK